MRCHPNKSCTSTTMRVRSFFGCRAEVVNLVSHAPHTPASNAQHATIQQCVCVCLSVSVTVTRPRCAHMLCVWGVNISRFFFGWTVFTVPLVYEIMHSLGVWSKRLRQNGDKPKRLPVQSKRINLLSPTMDLFSELLTKFQCIQVCSFCSSVIS